VSGESRSRAGTAPPAAVCPRGAQAARRTARRAAWYRWFEVDDIPLTAAWVARAMSASIVSGDPARVFAGVSIDSRTIAPGELFIAIRGERFDGADFVPAALQAGAAGVVVPAGRGGPIAAAAAPAAAAVLETDDTIAALQRLGRAVRRASGARLVAITGSAGKTTTKEMAAELLAARYRVTRNRGNLNNHIGLPLSLIALRRRPDVAVVELGMSRAGEIRTLVRLAEPDVRVWTNVGEAHLGFFESVDAIAEAKAEILEDAGPSSVLVANADDDRVMARASAFRGRVVTFGLDRPAAVHARRLVDRGVDGFTASVETPIGEVELATPLIGRGNAANLLAATAVAIELGVPLEAIAERARTLRPAPHRGEVVALRAGVVVIDDSYNANPTATRRAIDVLAAGRGGGRPAGRRVALLGEMLELGRQAVPLHEDVGRYAAAAAVDLLVAIGGEPARAIAAGAIAGGLPADAVRHFATSDEAASAIPALVRAGDLVLVKGSRGIRTDRIVERLKAEFG